MRRTIWSYAQSWARETEGSMISVLAISFLVMIGMGALAVDYSYHALVRNQLQTGADASAMAAVSQLPDLAAAQVVAKALALKNLPPDEHGNAVDDGEVELGVWDAGAKKFWPNVTPPNAVRVSVRRTAAKGNPVPTFFGRMFGITGTDMVISAVAAPPKSTSCLVALEPNQQAIDINSNSQIIATACDVHANSSNSTAIMVNSSSRLEASNINVKGQVQTNSGGVIVGTVNTGVAPINDPLANLAPPAQASNPCDHTNKVEVNTGDAALVPGVYCKGIEVKGNDGQMNPGIYIIKGDKFVVNSGASLSGSGVSIYLADKDALILINSGSSLDISAPTTGPMAGILFFQDRSTPEMSHEFNSDATSRLEGVVYLLNGEVTVNSSSQVGGTTPFLSFVARKYNINSDSILTLESDTVSSTVPTPFKDSKHVRLLQ